MFKMTTIDIHAHMFGLMARHIGAWCSNYASELMKDGRDYLMEMDAAACAFEPDADYDKRIAMMDASGIDVAISSPSPNCQWGGPEISAETAKLANDEKAEDRPLTRIEFAGLHRCGLP